MAALIDKVTDLPYLVKRPAPESRLYRISFVKFLVDIVGTPLIEIQPSGLVPETDILIVQGAITSADTDVIFRLENGTDKEDYELKFKVTDSSGNTISEDMMIKVRISGKIP